MSNVRMKSYTEQDDVIHQILSNLTDCSYHYQVDQISITISFYQMIAFHHLYLKANNNFMN